MYTYRIPDVPPPMNTTVFPSNSPTSSAFRFGPWGGVEERAREVGKGDGEKEGRGGG